MSIRCLHAGFCRWARNLVVLVLAWNSTGVTAGSQSALDAKGPPAEAIAFLFWSMLAVSGVILLAVLCLLSAGMLRARSKREPLPLTFTQSRNLVLLSGVVIPVLVLLAYVVGSASTNQKTVVSLPRDVLTIEITGNQWWWEAEYLGTNGKPLMKTANEIHIPVGRPVRLLLKSNDVIHSFWVPNLNGKTDMIPGKTNVSWIQADRPGAYRGQCAEFCGRQHAHMGFVVHARLPAAFDAWFKAQLMPAREPTTLQQQRGQQVFMTSSCLLCHTIRGTRAMASVAPDLTHFASRGTLAAATQPISRATLSAWILAPQAMKPGTHMPAIPLDVPQLTDLVEYLMSLE